MLQIAKQDRRKKERGQAGEEGSKVGRNEGRQHVQTRAHTVHTHTHTEASIFFGSCNFDMVKVIYQPLLLVSAKLYAAFFSLLP